MQTTTETNDKVDLYVKNHDTFNQAEWDKVKNTIPQAEQVEAEGRVRAQYK